MNSNHQRLDVWIDVFSETKQHHGRYRCPQPAALIEGILQEFRKEIAYLGERPSQYELRKLEDGMPLDEMLPLNQQVSDNARLVLAEKELPIIPDGTTRPTPFIYLCEQSTNTVYKLHWLPAIGRMDQSQPDNGRLAVDLGAYAIGLRVSRRHAMITQSGHEFYIENLKSNNPIFLCDPTDNRLPVTTTPHLLQDGDRILLERSNIWLKFLVRSPKDSAVVQ